MPCVTHSSGLPLMWGEGKRCRVHHQKISPTLNGGWCLSVVFPLCRTCLWPVTMLLAPHWTPPLPRRNDPLSCCPRTCTELRLSSGQLSTCCSPRLFGSRVSHHLPSLLWIRRSCSTFLGWSVRPSLVFPRLWSCGSAFVPSHCHGRGWRHIIR